MSLLISLDKYVGTWAPRFAQYARRRVGGIVQPERPLVIRPGGLGDLVVATAALEDVGVSAQSVDWLIERRSEPWANYLGLNYACYDRPDRRLALCVNKTRSLVVNLEQRYGLAAAAATVLTARDGTLCGFSSNRGASCYELQVTYDHDEHELLAFKRAFSVALQTTYSPSRLRPRAKERGAYIVLAIAGTAQESRRLQDDDWLALIRSRITGPLVIASAPSDEKIAIRLASQVSSKTSIAVGFAAVVEAISGAERIVTIDGGLVHVAAYFGVPVDAVFTAGRSKKWSPWSEGSSVIMRTDLECQPCTLFGIVPKCRNSFACRDRSHWVHRPVEQLG